MDELKTSQEVNYTAFGQVGKQCRGCKSFAALDDNYGNCLGHKVSIAGSCDYFTAK